MREACSIFAVDAFCNLLGCCVRRYNPKKGELTLVCEKYPDREENRRDILDTLHALVAGEPAGAYLDTLHALVASPAGAILDTLHALVAGEPAAGPPASNRG